MSDHPELVALVLIAAVAALLGLTRVTRVPYPIVLFLGGAVISLLPGLPAIEVEPDVMLLAILPPLLFTSAYNSSLGELRRLARPVTLLPTVLVVITTVVVAVVAHAALGLPWAVAFVLGAIVSPTDPVAATSIAERLGAPRRLVAVLEGESLVNDASALVLYRVAVAAAVTGGFSLGDAALDLVGGALLGVVIGAVVGEALVRLLGRMVDAPLANVLTLLGLYLAYLPAEVLGGSAVLAVVTAGLVLGWRSPARTSPSVRLAGTGFFDSLTYLLNALVFVFVGLQVAVVLEAASSRSTAELVLDALLVTGVVVGVRFVWLFTAPYVIRRLDRRPEQVARRVGWRERVVTGWAGMRGAVSLAVAVAVPTSVADRDLVLVLTYGVIFFTLVVQGLTLPGLIRLLGVREDSRRVEMKEAKARAAAAGAAIARLEEINAEGALREFTFDRVRGTLAYRQRRWTALAGGEVDGEETDYEGRAADYKELQRELLRAQHAEVLGRHAEGKLGIESLHRIERDLDLEFARLEE